MFNTLRLACAAGVLTFSCAACSGSSQSARPPRDAAAADAPGPDDTHTGSAAVGGGQSGSAGAAGGEAGGYYKPVVGSSWQIQYAGALDTSIDAQNYDIDLYDTPQERIDELHAAGRKVICYFDTAYEAWRADAKELEPYKGNPLDGWPDQYWLDIRRPEVFKVMLKRLDMAAAKGCDGVDPDDVDARSNRPGFPITAADQQGFIKKLAAAAHERGLAVGLKNDLEEVAVLIDHVDFAVNEECFENHECELLMPFIRAGKPVFNVEYTDGDLKELAADICTDAERRKFSSLAKRLNLNAERVACRIAQ